MSCRIKMTAEEHARGEMKRRVRRINRRHFFEAIFKLTVGATLCLFYLSAAIGLGITLAEFLK